MNLSGALMSGQVAVAGPLKKLTRQGVVSVIAIDNKLKTIAFIQQGGKRKKTTRKQEIRETPQACYKNSLPGRPTRLALSP